MSVPLVSGVAALVWSQYPALSKSEVRQILTSTADDIGTSGRDIYYGYGKANSYRAVSYLPGWSYRKQKTISGTTAGAQTNYQMKLTIYNTSGTDTPGVVYLNGSARSDFGDLRFTKSDGVTLLDYWIESYTSGVSAVVWVEVDSIPASPGTVDIYLYYGNPSATSASNGAATFAFFDDFNGDSIDTSKWNTSGTVTVSNSEVTGQLLSKQGFATGNHAIRARARAVSANTYVTYMGWSNQIGGGSSLACIIYRTACTNPLYSCVSMQTYSPQSNSNVAVTGRQDDTNYHIFEARKLSSTATFTMDNTYNDGSLPASSTYIIPIAKYVWKDNANSGTGSAATYWDWVLVHNFVSPEPAWA